MFALKQINSFSHFHILHFEVILNCVTLIEKLFVAVDTILSIFSPLWSTYEKMLQCIQVTFHIIYIKYKKANELDDSFWLIKLDSINLIAFHIHCCIPNSYSGRFLGCSFRYPIKALILAFCTSYLFGGCVIRICVFGFSSLSNKNRIVKD